MLANGIYKTGKTGLNLPFESYWIIITFNTSNNLGNSSTAWITQFAISTDSSDKAIYFRRNIDINGIKNGMYADWNTFKTGVAVVLYRNFAEALFGLIYSCDHSSGCVLLLKSWGSLKVYRHYGTVFTGIYGVS